MMGLQQIFGLQGSNYLWVLLLLNQFAFSLTKPFTYRQISLEAMPLCFLSPKNSSLCQYTSQCTSLKGQQQVSFPLAVIPIQNSCQRMDKDMSQTAESECFQRFSVDLKASLRMHLMSTLLCCLPCQVFSLWPETYHSLHCRSCFSACIPLSERVMTSWDRKTKSRQSFKGLLM